MKKLKVILMMVAIVMVVSACSGNVKKPQDPVDGPTSQEEAVVIRSSEIPDEVLGWNEVSRYTGDVDGDGIDENVVLVTSAECDDDGEFFWNDGQNWAFFVDDRDDKYLLMNGYLNAGAPYFEISDYYLKDGAKPEISLIVSTGAGFSMKNYCFSETEKGYVENVIFDTKDVTEGGINRRYSSIPEYDERVE